MRRAANPTDTRLAASMASWRVSPAREANSPPLCLSTATWRSPPGYDHALVLRRASMVYPYVPVLAVPSRHRPARTAGRNRTNRHQTAPQVTYKHVMALARNRQVGGSNPPSGSRSAALFRSSVVTLRLTFVPIRPSVRGCEGVRFEVGVELLGARGGTGDLQPHRVCPDAADHAESGTARAQGARTGRRAPVRAGDPVIP